jgi:uncharacterized protein (TIGR00290 family)
MTTESRNASPDRTVALWSGGKDAAWMLRELLSDPTVEVAALMTTVVEDVRTVTTHGTPLSLIRRQADAMDLPLHVMTVPPEPSNATYEERFERALAPLRAQGISSVAAGDLHLEDIRAYREGLMKRLQMTPRFPIWNRDSHVMARDMLDRGMESIVVSVDTTQLDASFTGRRYDESFLADLPHGVDPCGENGEFHTFTFNAPMFERPVPVEVVGEHGTGRMRYARLGATEDEPASRAVA